VPRPSIYGVRLEMRGAVAACERSSAGVDTFMSAEALT